MKTMFVKITMLLMIGLLVASGCQNKEKAGTNATHSDSLSTDSSKKSGLDQAPLEGNNDGANQGDM